MIIDYGATFVAGIQETGGPVERDRALGTLNCSAPEYFLGCRASRQSDLFSLVVIMYEALTGKLSYGNGYGRCRSRPSIERCPLLFWKMVAGTLAVALMASWIW